MPTLNADPIALSPVRGNILSRKLIIVAFDVPSQQQMASVRVVKLAQQLIHSGWSITILTNQPGLRDFFQMEQMDSVEVISFKNSDSFNPFFWPLQNFEKTDGILSIGARSHFVGALIKLKNLKASWLMDEGALNVNADQSFQTRHSIWARYFFQQATCVSVPDESSRKQYTQPLAPKLKTRFVTLRNDYTPGGTEATETDDSIDQEIAAKVHRILSRKARRPKIFH